MSDQQEEIKMSCSIWQSQSVAMPEMSPEFIRSLFRKKSRSLKNERVGLIVTVMGTISYFFMAAFKHGSVTNYGRMDFVFGAAAVLFLGAIMCRVVYVHKHYRVKVMAPEFTSGEGLAIYRSELERLRQLARRDWHTLLYVAPSFLTLLVGGLIVDQRPGKAWRYGLTLAVGIVVGCFAFWEGSKKARCLQRDLDAVNSMK